MTFSIPSSLESAYEECGRLSRKHYENFPVASLLLPRESRAPIASLYAFARTADDFADEPEFEGRRIAEINQWQKSLQNALQGRKALPVLQAFAHTLKTFQIPIQLPMDLLKAYRMDLTIRRYQTWNDLLNYCRHSANPVGRMVLLISGIRDEKLHRYSDFICGGLQLINFWQDSSIDLKRGRIYYPIAELKKAGVKVKDLLDLKDSPAVRELARNAVDYTEVYFQQGVPLLQSLSARLGLEIRATYWGGRGILGKIRELDYNILQTRPTWTPWDKVMLALRAVAATIPPM
jgi:squalene synthase HpnC